MPSFDIENLVTSFTRTAEFPSEWFVVTLRRPISGLFANDFVTFAQEEWAVHEIRGGGRELVLRPV